MIRYYEVTWADSDGDECVGTLQLEPVIGVFSFTSSHIIVGAGMLSTDKTYKQDRPYRKALRAAKAIGLVKPKVKPLHEPRLSQLKEMAAN